MVLATFTGIGNVTPIVFGILAFTTSGDVGWGLKDLRKADYTEILYLKLERFAGMVFVRFRVVLTG